MPRSVSGASFVVSRTGESHGSLDTELISIDVCTTYSEESEKGDLNSVPNKDKKDK